MKKPVWSKNAFHVVDNGLTRVNMSPRESKITFAVFHLTFNKHRKTREISVDRFAKMTRLDRRTVEKTLKRLVERKVIVREQGKIGFNINCAEWVRRAAERERT